MRRPFLDTSILIGGLIDFGAASEAPIELLDLIAAGRVANASTAWHCCLEFYSVATRLPEEYRLTPETAREFVIEEIMGRFAIRTLDPAQQEAFLSDLAKTPIRGGRIYDHHIGTIALRSRASVLVTENKKHFLPFGTKGLPAMTAREFLNASTPSS